MAIRSAGIKDKYCQSNYEKIASQIISFCQKEICIMTYNSKVIKRDIRHINQIGEEAEFILQSAQIKTREQRIWPSRFASLLE